MNTIEIAIVEIEITTIRVGPRRRMIVGDLRSLMASIDRLGLLHPVTVTEDTRLVVGWRRLVACQALGWTTIPAQRIGRLTSEEIWAVELEENTGRE